MSNGKLNGTHTSRFDLDSERTAAGWPAMMYLLVIVIALQAFQLVSGHMFKSDVRHELDETHKLVKQLQDRRVIDELKAIREAVKKAQ